MFISMLMVVDKLESLCYTFYKFMNIIDNSCRNRLCLNNVYKTLIYLRYANKEIKCILKK